MFYRRALRPLLFTQDPEFAHERTLELLALASGTPLCGQRPFTHVRLKTTVAGIEFPNPVGLAAGCDKNAKAVTIWPRFGFGFIEVGTITAQAQPGNPKPRVFRIPEQDALVNRLGFNSEGSEAVAKRLAHLRRHARALPVPLGVNIGKTKIVIGDDATLDDYRTSFRRLAPYADFVVVNVSSPNTPGLRQWQEKDKLRALLGMLMEEQGVGCRVWGVGKTPTEETGNREQNQLPDYPTPYTLHPTPVFVKISPDMADADMDDVAEVALEVGLAGIIATNTTIGREGAVAGVRQEGGLSGRPLRDRATEVIRTLYRRTEGRLPLIGVGGIFTAEDAYARIRAGASLVQFYTGMIYEGPYLARRINAGLLRLMEHDGVQRITEVVGVGA